MTVTALVKQIGDRRYRASISQPMLLETEADTPGQAVQQLRQMAMDQIAGGQLVEISLPGSNEPNPWLAIAGAWKDHPDLEQYLQNIADYRRQVDEDESAP
jgi:hypothetical protein